MPVLRLAGTLNDSTADGPGLRYVVFAQGCPFRCEGCHNPQTHDPEGGSDADVDGIKREIEANPLLSGLTLSGGEPFVQAAALLPLAEWARGRGLTVMTYTGYTWEELTALAAEAGSVSALLAATDWLVDGRFALAERDLTLRFRGSRNQRILDVARSLAAGAPVKAEI